MSYPSKRKQLLDALEALILLAALNNNEEAEEKAVELHALVASSLYHGGNTISKRPRHYYENRFPTLSAEEFWSMFRTTREGFSALLEKIHDNPVFANNSNHKQADPSFQLAVALARLGTHGTRASVGKMQEVFGIGTGTVTLYTNRVLQALWGIRNDWIKWPNAGRRSTIGQIMRADGFPNCIGFVHGTTLPLSQKPAINGDVYFDRMERYSVAMQVICDVDKRIINLHVGCPGSTADSTIYKLMNQYKRPHCYFSPGEYILGDSAYNLLTTCITPFQVSSANNKENKEFNYCHAKSRVRVEHCISMLKSRWGSLQEMRKQIRSPHDVQSIIRWVVGCCVLYNMLAHFGDKWEDMYLEASDSLHEDTLARVGEAQSDQSAVNFREALKKTTLETNYAHGLLPLRQTN